MEISCRADKFYLFHMKNTLFLYYAEYINITIFSTHFQPEVILSPSRKKRLKPRYFTNWRFACHTSLSAHFCSSPYWLHTAHRKNGLRLVWQSTCQFPQKSMSIFGAKGCRRTDRIRFYVKYQTKFSKNLSTGRKKAHQISIQRGNKPVCQSKEALH